MTALFLSILHHPSALPYLTIIQPYTTSSPFEAAIPASPLPHSSSVYSPYLALHPASHYLLIRLVSHV